ncbi:stonustoxin subunit alpha-like [Sander lucioperca]|uniref:stonustoxin subunit alpha-like n=1 Tax=Sander lucioperca TaxID=283035 RepID=UPI0016536BDE|nr:stonustoxin subunit alpha-like [Sander lucioperca]
MDSGASRTMEMAALGRPFGLGMLYDCRQDSLIPGMTLWDRDDLISYIGERPQNYNDFEIVASESIADKTSALNVEASLKASFLSGLVEVGGSAKYLNDSKTSKNQVRVTLKYKATTKVKELSMDHLGRGHVKHPYVFDKGLATHVVTAILYGAQAFFVFDREVSQKEDHKDIQGNLKMMIKKIPSITIEGEGSLRMEDKDREKVDKYSCRFFGDFSLQKSPTTFQDAVEVYRRLPKLLGANGENAVPMKVWLLPLTSLDSSAAKLIRQISIRLVQESQSVLEDFSELEMRCNDALRTTIAQQFPQIGKKIKSFKELSSEFKLGFQQTLAKKLPSIRGGEEEEDGLTEILKKRHSSPFNSKNLNEWMDCKEREIDTLMSFTNMMKNTKIVPSQTDLYTESLSSDHAVCFVFTSLGRDEPYLSALSNYLKQTPEDLQHAHTHDVEKEEWYASREVVQEMRHKAKLFSDFAEANKENKKIKFLTVGSTSETQKGSSFKVHLYEDGFSVNENFEPPSKPETVTISDINHNSVTLKVSPPRFGAEDITSYSAEYCVSGEDKWKQKTASKAEEVTVSNLSPNTEVDGKVYKAAPDRHEGDPSTSKTDLDVSEDRREDQLSPDDPERLKQQQLVCGEAPDTNEMLYFTPELLTESGKTSYRFRCPGPGVFQCDLTGLVFVMTQEAELLYNTVQWDESLLQSAGRMAAGPLFDIKCSEDGAVCQLHLPHCETKDALLVDGLLSVVHITDDGMNILEPLKITDTHVVVKVPHLSAFGLIWDIVRRFQNKSRQIEAQVLLFLRPPDTGPRVLDVLLLPRNVLLDEVEKQQRGSKHIRISSKCQLSIGQSYSVHCQPEGFIIQPEHETFSSDYGPNYHPTFEVFLETIPEKVTLMVQDRERRQVWRRYVSLKGLTGPNPRRNDPAEDSDPPEDRLLLVRRQFVQRVSDPVLNQLLDKLLERRVITDGEMQSVRTGRADKARDVMDTVRRKGSAASSVLISALCEVDPVLSRELRLI